MYSYPLRSSWKIAKIGKISQLQAQTAVSYSIADIQTKTQCEWLNGTKTIFHQPLHLYK